MSDLIVVAYPDTHRATEVMIVLQRLQKQYLIEVEDSCVVIKDGCGKIKVIQSTGLTAAGAVEGGFWGGLIGLMFLHPLIGIAVGMGAGSIRKLINEYGISDGFIKQLSAKLEPDTSAVFLLVRKITTDKVFSELSPFGGHVLRTSLSRTEENYIETVLQNVAVRDILYSEYGVRSAIPDLDESSRGAQTYPRII